MLLVVGCDYLGENGIMGEKKRDILLGVPPYKAGQLQ